MGCGCGGRKTGEAQASPDGYPDIAGNPVQVWPGWVTNGARNNGADINPIPIVPARYGNWTAIQMQLKNGLELSTFGRRDNYDNYLRLLTTSGDMPGNKGIKQLMPGFQPAGAVQPSAVQLQNMISASAPNPTLSGGTGSVDPSILNNRKTFYG